MPNFKTVEAELADSEELNRKKSIELTQLRGDIRALQRENDTAEKIREIIFNLSAHPVDPPDWVEGRGGLRGARGAPTTIWSDFHYGEVVNPDEVNGVNEFNADIAEKRFRRLVNRTYDLCKNHMGPGKMEYPGITICLGGDMIGGDIHEELANTNDRTPHQAVNELTDLLAAGIDYLAGKFGRVFLPCVVGNHGRSTRKPRNKGRVFTNYDWVIYCNPERYFRKEKNITIAVSNSSDYHFRMFGHRYLLTHGDTLGVKGGDGIIGALGPIMRGTMKVNRSEQQVGRDFDTILMGHWHQYITLPGLICNNSLKGYDEYTMNQLRAPSSRPSQALWFTHPEHGITAHWQVYLEDRRYADENKSWVVLKA